MGDCVPTFVGFWEISKIIQIIIKTDMNVSSIFWHSTFENMVSTLGKSTREDIEVRRESVYTYCFPVTCVFETWPSATNCLRFPSVLMNNSFVYPTDCFLLRLLLEGSPSPHSWNGSQRLTVCTLPVCVLRKHPTIVSMRSRRVNQPAGSLQQAGWGERWLMGP